MLEQQLAPPIATPPPPARSPLAPRRELVAWGAHGGAGTSTLAALLRPCWDMGTLRRRTDPRFPAVHTYGRPLIIVCRNTVAAAERATAAVMAVAQPGGQVAALAVIADGAGREPREAVARFRLLESRVGLVVRVPFVAALRLVDDPTSVDLPRRAEQAVDQLRALAVGRLPCLCPGRSKGVRDVDDPCRA
ncbi:MAG TPA: hypothetical protein VGL93_17295 [Streptosporangiaceae bacterium]|jgi:hypothetical protein